MALSQETKVKMNVDWEMEKMAISIALFQRLEREAFSSPMPDGSPRSAENAHQVAKLLYAEHAAQGVVDGLVGASEQLRDNLLQVTDSIAEIVTSGLQNLADQD